MERSQKLCEIKEYKVNRDLPFYVSRDSADVWSNKSLFSILKNGDLIFQSGTPLFSSTGQLWGTPTYFGQNIRKLISIGGKRFKGNLNWLTY